MCLGLGWGFDVHGELGRVFFEEWEGESGFCGGVGGEFCVGRWGGVDGDVPDNRVGDDVCVGVVGGDVVGGEFVFDVVFCFGFVFCLDGVGDDGVGRGVVDGCDVVEVEDELLGGFVVVGVGDGSFYGVGCFSHTPIITNFYNLSIRKWCTPH